MTDSTPRDPWASSDLYQALDELRGDNVTFTQDSGRWHMVEYEAVCRVLRDAKNFSSDPRTSGAPPAMAAAIPPSEYSLLLLDPPRHTRLRALQQRAFTPKAVDGLRPVIDQLARRLLDRYRGCEKLDLVEALAAPLPTLVIAKFIGVEESDQSQFKKRSEEIATVLDPFLTEEGAQRVLEARKETHRYFEKLIADRRHDPKDDFITRLVEVQRTETDLSDTDIAVICNTLIIAGNVTTTDLITNCVAVLLSHPVQLDRVRQDRSLVGRAVEEAARFDAPFVCPRRVSTCALEGVPAGANVAPWIAGANHDPKVFPDPGRFDLDRNNLRDHLAFGMGPHYCLGAPLGRLEAQVALNVILDSFSQFGIEGEPERRQYAQFRGFGSLPLRVTWTV